MFPTLAFDAHARHEMAAAGDVVRWRQQLPTSVLHLDSGRVLLGIQEKGHMRHQLGVVEGPFQITSLEYAGAHDGEVTFEISMESAGLISFEAAS